MQRVYDVLTGVLSAVIAAALAWAWVGCRKALRQRHQAIEQAKREAKAERQRALDAEEARRAAEEERLFGDDPNIWQPLG